MQLDLICCSIIVVRSTRDQIWSAGADRWILWFQNKRRPLVCYKTRHRQIPRPGGGLEPCSFRQTNCESIKKAFVTFHKKRHTITSTLVWRPQNLPRPASGACNISVSASQWNMWSIKGLCTLHMKLQKNADMLHTHYGTTFCINCYGFFNSFV